jgi:pilus assembly protein CpaF
MDDLVRAGTLSSQMADFLGTCVAARRNVVVCGGAGAGKTSFLGAIAGLAPAAERIVSVEEVAELALARDHWIALESRPPDADGKGGVGLRDVLNAALRMRPDRLVVGELRGAEAFELVSAMASANDGSLVSVVAEGARSALARIESLARLGAREASGRGVRDLVAQACHVVVHLMRFADGVRRVSSVAEVTGGEGEGYGVRELFSFHVQGHGADGAVRGRFAGAGVVPRFYEALEARGLPADPAVFNR